MDINTTHLMNLLKNSAKFKYINKGKLVQAHLFKLGHHNLLSLQNQLLNVYVKCNEYWDAFNLFGEMRVRNIVTWNTLLCGTAGSGARSRSILDMGFCYFKRMLSQNVALDRITFTSLLRMSIELYDEFIGKQLHCFVVKFGLCMDCFVNSALVDFYSRFGLVNYSRRVFDCCGERDLVMWNAMISCYASNHLAKEAYSLFGLMRSEGVHGDVFTFSNLLNSSAIFGFFELGKQVQSLSIHLSFDADVVVASTLVDMYAKNDDIVNARKAFDGMIYKTTISWNTMIVGYGLNDENGEVMKLMRDMIREKLYLDELTLSSIISSCANSSSYNEILHIHCFALRNGFHSFASVSNSLINAYSKCGNIDMAFECFCSIVVPDLVSWSSMIRAYAYYGFPKKSIEFFEKMVENDINPDPVSFLGVLSACSHGGMVNEGIYYFNLMTNYYKIEPCSEHYTCFIDLLGRAGLVNDAFTLITSMNCEPTSNALEAFIGACKVHGNSKFANWAMEKLIVTRPNKSVNYSILSNLYARDGLWVDVAKVRKAMKETCDYKVPGCSWIEIHNELYTFVSRDRSHPRSLEVYSLLNALAREMEKEYHSSEDWQ